VFHRPVPELMLGGVHGEHEAAVYAELCAAVEEWVEQLHKDRLPLPETRAADTFSGSLCSAWSRLASPARRQGAGRGREPQHVLCKDTPPGLIRRRAFVPTRGSRGSGHGPPKRRRPAGSSRR